MKIGQITKSRSLIIMSKISSVYDVTGYENFFENFIFGTVIPRSIGYTEYWLPYTVYGVYRVYLVHPVHKLTWRW